MTTITSFGFSCFKIKHCINVVNILCVYMTMLLIYYEFGLIWNKFNENNLLKNSSTIFFGGDS
jgi:hypothetical protein